MARRHAPSRAGTFLSRAWAGIVTGVIWAGIFGAAVATVVNGSGETGGNILVVVGWTVASMAWGGFVVWSFRREPMRKMAADIRDGQDRIIAKMEEQSPSEPPRLAVVRPFRGA